MRILTLLTGALLLLEACAGGEKNAAAPGIEAAFSVPIPPGLDARRTWKIVSEPDGRELPCRIVGGSVVWIDTLPGAMRIYQIKEGECRVSRRVECGLEEGKHLTLQAAGRNVLRYAIGIVEPPSGSNPLHASAGFIHPVWTPSGQTVSDNFPKSHEHHHGVWSAWRQGEFEGRPLNGFAPLEKLGRMEFVSLDGIFSGSVLGGFRAIQRLIDFHAPGGPKPAIEERWDVKVYGTQGTFLFDIDSTQSAVGESAFTVKKYHYGGMGFRGSTEWAGKNGVAFLTSEGKTRLDGNGLPARWVAMNGKIGGKAAGVGFLCHPSSFRAPQPTRLNPDDPYFSWVPACTADFDIERRKPIASRYRFIVADRTLTADEMERHWRAYAEPEKLVALRVP